MKITLRDNYLNIHVVKNGQLLGCVLEIDLHTLEYLRMTDGGIECSTADVVVFGDAQVHLGLLTNQHPELRSP